MKYIYTDLYEEFSCVGGKCPDSCCKGWEIIVDSDTYNNYLALEEPLRSKVCSNIEEVHTNGEKKYIMKLEKENRCPFLNDSNLCNIYIDISPNAMCNTCKTYPRKIHKYYDTTMMTVMVSCPEVTRRLLNKTEGISFYFGEDDNRYYIGEANWELYNELINGLVLTTDILQDRDLPLWERLYLVMCLTYDIQSHITDNRLMALRENVECYSNREYRRVKISERPIRSFTGKCFLVYSIFEEVERLINTSSKEKRKIVEYKRIDKEDETTFQNWCNNFDKVAIKTEYENLAVEFVFEYYMEALRGKDIFESIVKMMLLLVLIKYSEIIEYNLQGRLVEEEKVLLISNIARIMEHSPKLDIMVEQLIKRNGTENLFQLAYLLG